MIILLTVSIIAAYRQGVYSNAAMSSRPVQPVQPQRIELDVNSEKTTTPSAPNTEPESIYFSSESSFMELLTSTSLIGKALPMDFELKNLWDTGSVNDVDSPIISTVTGFIKSYMDGSIDFSLFTDETRALYREIYRNFPDGKNLPIEYRIGRITRKADQATVPFRMIGKKGRTTGNFILKYFQTDNDSWMILSVQADFSLLAQSYQAKKEFFPDSIF